MRVPERITEAEIAAAGREWAKAVKTSAIAEANWAQDWAECLVAEVRRLRGLIGEMDAALEAATMAPPAGKVMFIAAAAPRFMAEAEAVRAERGEPHA